MRSAFQNVMNISTLSNIREELWLADSDIPPLRKKCSGQAGLPGSLPPCAETLAREDAGMALYKKVNVTIIIVVIVISIIIQYAM